MQSYDQNNIHAKEKIDGKPYDAFGRGETRTLRVSDPSEIYPPQPAASKKDPMGKLIKESRAVSFGKKALLVSAFLFFSSLLVMLTANAQPLAEEKKGLNPTTAIFSSQKTYDTSTRGRVPEPSTLALMGSGFIAALVRFARRRFDEFKRVLDVCVAMIGIIAVSPLLLAAAFLVKVTSSGPIIFRQTRVGKNGKTFELFKLRTMVQDAEKKTGPVWASENDPRVTPVGRSLRKSHIDELPQLINVLQGHMSLIGPRPERPEFVSRLSREISDYQKRLAVRPGITGLSQVKHSYDATLRDVRKKIKLDILYIKRMCFLTDLRILFSTVAVVLTGRGAR